MTKGIMHYCKQRQTFSRSLLASILLQGTSQSTIVTEQSGDHFWPQWLQLVTNEAELRGLHNTKNVVSLDETLDNKAATGEISNNNGWS